MNIYEHLKSLPENSYIITSEMQSFLIQSFANFFNKSLNLNESFKDLCFAYSGANMGNNISLNYNFKYGHLTLSMSQETLYSKYGYRPSDTVQNVLFVHFQFYNSVIQKLKIPFESNNFVVYTNQDLAYQYTEFEKNFELRYNMKSCSRLKISQLVMPDRIENILVSNLFYGYDLKAKFTSTNHLSKKLAERYFKMDDEFRNYLTKFLLLCDYKSNIFTDIFTDYAELILHIKDHSNVIDLLNMFERHYSENIEDLNAKMLVSTMSLI